MKFVIISLYESSSSVFNDEASCRTYKRWKVCLIKAVTDYSRQEWRTSNVFENILTSNQFKTDINLRSPLYVLRRSSLFLVEFNLILRKPQLLLLLTLVYTEVRI